MKYNNDLPKHKDASKNKVSDLIFTARQRLSWFEYYKSKNKPALANIYYLKHIRAVNALKTLGVDFYSI